MKIVCVSDTHGFHNALKLPQGDMIIHAGDITKRGEKDQEGYLLPKNSWVVLGYDLELAFLWHSLSRKQRADTSSDVHINLFPNASSWQFGLG